MEIRKICSKEKSMIDEVVDIHIMTFKGFFLTFMGRKFLRQMYQAYVIHETSDIIVSIEDNKVIGFLAYSADLSGLYKYMIKNYLIQFSWYSMGAFFRNPSVFMRLIRAFLKPSEAKRKEEYIELSSIGVHPDKKLKGIGSELIDYLKNNIDFNKYEYITLETDAVDNIVANQFYKKNGFILIREFETYEGRKMNEYRYSEEIK